MRGSNPLSAGGGLITQNVRHCDLGLPMRGTRMQAAYPRAEVETRSGVGVDERHEHARQTVGRPDDRRIHIHGGDTLKTDRETIMKRLTTITLAALTLLALAGCGSTPHEPKDSTTESATRSQCSSDSRKFQTCTVTMPDTRRVTCVFYDGYTEAATSCDWAHADGADKVED